MLCVLCTSVLRSGVLRSGVLRSGILSTVIGVSEKSIRK